MNSIGGLYFDTINFIDATCERQVLEEAFGKCEYYEKTLSRFEPESDVSRINRAGGKPVTVSDDTVNVLRLALSYHELSGGAFDPSLGAVSARWKQSLAEDRIPGTREARELLPKGNFSETRICGNEVTVPAGLELDLGGIAKGYIEDRVADELRRAGVQNALLNFGGNILAIGGHPRGDAWRIGLKKPFGSEKDFWAVAACRDGAISTSGTYERGKTIGNARVHHILDPETGFPVDNKIVAVSVFARTAAEADALSTAFFVSGPEKGPQIAAMKKALFVCLMEDGRFFKSPELKLEVSGISTSGVEWTGPASTEHRVGMI